MASTDATGFNEFNRQLIVEFRENDGTVTGPFAGAPLVLIKGAERDRLYRAQADLMPNSDEYQEKTERTIPVVVLERI